jgi:CHAD domain-containing protein
VIQATDRLAGSVVLAIPPFRLLPGEELGPGLKRLGVETIDEAIQGFYDGEEVFGQAVHTARKAMKRIRALLRLIRHEIGDRVYGFENAWMRDTARLVSDVRASAVLVKGAEEIRGLYGALLAEGTFDEVIERLEARRDRTAERAMEDPAVVPKVVSNLERARGRYQTWPTDPDAKSAYGMGLSNRYESVGPGVRATHAGGRQEMVAAYQAPSATSFHRWRKSVKYLQHQFEILIPLWPEVMIGMALTLNRIGDLLGQDHDLAELLQLLADRPDICPNPVERSMMSALASQRRSDLQTASRILGRRIYTESPTSLDVRLGAYWESMELARTTRFASLSA